MKKLNQIADFYEKKVKGSKDKEEKDDPKEEASESAKERKREAKAGDDDSSECPTCGAKKKK